MNRLVIGVLALMLSSVSFGVDVDLAASKVKWMGSKAVGSHNGTVALKSGTVSFDKANTLNGGTFVIDMNAIVNEDLTDASYNKKLVDHLKSADFFDVAKYPTATFTIKSVKKGKASNSWDVTGDMKIKDVTKTITIPVTVTNAGKAKLAVAKFDIDRTHWNVKYNSAKFFDIKKLKDKIINDKITLELSVKTKA